jgi:hypothetical protein
MTKFEELTDIIARKKNKNENKTELDNDDNLEVAGSESSKTPLISCGDDEMDMDLVDQLYRKPRNVPNRGEGSAAWDATWD